jgi:drug/metabolite transporter (DMT)-like permease
LVLAAGAVWSLTGLAVRTMRQADGLQITFYRSLGVVPVVLILIAFRRHGKVVQAFRAAGWRAVFAGLFMAVSNMSAIFALLNTTVANTTFMLGLGPLLTAVGGRVFFGERLDRSSWWWFLVAAGGVGIMTVGAAGGGRLFGNLMALLMVVTYAAFSLIIRHGRATDMNPAIVWAGIFAGVAAYFASADLLVPRADAITGIFIGAAFMGGGLVLYVAGSHAVPAAELVLLGLVEIVLAPTWVWIFFAERPSPATLVGGAVVMAAVLAGAQRQLASFTA